MELSYILNELGEDRHLYFNAIAPPIIQTSNFAFDKVDDLRKAFQDEMGGYIYSRGVNPTVDILRKKLAALDGTEDSLVFSNGAAAIFAGVFANVKAGDHIISVTHPYSWAAHLFDRILPRFKINTTYVDGTQVSNFRDAIRPNTTLIYLESPNSWFFDIQDLAAIAALAHTKQITTFVDNSYCTPVFQKPAELGIDLVMQTATKFIGGHSDTLGGVISGSRERIRKIFESEFLCVGSGIQPFNAWMLLRGLRSLPARLKQISESTRKVLAYLKSEPKVEATIFPLDPDFPQYGLAKQQMKDCGGLISFYIRAISVSEIETFCEALRHIRMAVSWGGHESLIIPRCAGLPAEDFDPDETTHRMLRLYVGLEDPDYLIQDLRQAFSVSVVGG